MKFTILALGASLLSHMRFAWSMPAGDIDNTTLEARATNKYVFAHFMVSMIHDHGVR